MILKFDFYTIFTLIKLNIPESISDNKLYEYLVCLGQTNQDSSNNPHRHIIGETQISGASNSNIVHKAKLEYISRTYEQLLSEYLSFEKQKLIITAVKKILASDPSVQFDEDVENATGYIKENIINENEFCFYTLLASIFKRVIGISNSHRKDYKQYRQDLTDFYNDLQADQIKLIPLDSVFPPIRKTSKLNHIEFKRIFSEVVSTTLPEEFKNVNNIKVYMLQLQNAKFRFGDLSDFIKDNIEHYVMSAIEEKSYYDNEKTKHLINDAINKFKKKTKDEDLINAYSKLMLYIFMECGLGAPKLFNAIELENKQIKSDGVYYLPKGSLMEESTIILGTAHTFDNIEEALNNSIIQAKVIVDNYDEISLFINPNFLSQKFEHEDLNYLVNRLIKAEHILKNDTGIGIFLSYSLNDTYDGTMNNYTYREHIKKKMEDDIKAKIPFILEKIKENNLLNYHMFIFVLPLFNVKEDTKEIMTGFLEAK